MASDADESLDAICASSSAANAQQAHIHHPGERVYIWALRDKVLLYAGCASCGSDEEIIGLCINESAELSQFHTRFHEAIKSYRGRNANQQG